MRSTTTAATALAVLLAAAVSLINAADKPAGTTQEPERPANAQASKLDEQLKHMREMHEKMLAAKTPEERQALMADQMKVMQEWMKTMQQMHSKSGKGGMSSQMMEKRMEMMEMMMQMMMDRQGMGGMGMEGMGKNK